jgi:acyl-CoA synthetase (AMP-forming)/AMP-acid ligase II
VLREGSNASADALREWANGRLGKTQRLNAVEIVDALARSAIGKVLKRELRDQWIASSRPA